MRVVLGMAFLGALAAQPVAGQRADGAGPVGRAVRFEGCWTPINLVDDASRPVTCILPSDSAPGALEMRQLSRGGEALAPTSLIPIGAPLSRRTAPGCTTTEHARWSADSLQLYIGANEVCGTTPATVGHALMAVEGKHILLIVRSTTDGTLVDRMVQDTPPLDSAGSALVSVVTNAMHRGQVARATGTPAFTPVGLREAIDATSAPVVEAWIMAWRRPVKVRASLLRALRAEGVPTRTIDVLVVKARPDVFAAGREWRARPDTAPVSRPHGDPSGPGFVTASAQVRQAHVNWMFTGPGWRRAQELFIAHETPARSLWFIGDVWLSTQAARDRDDWDPRISTQSVLQRRPLLPDRRAGAGTRESGAASRGAESGGREYPTPSGGGERGSTSSGSTGSTGSGGASAGGGYSPGEGSSSTGRTAKERP